MVEQLGAELRYLCVEDCVVAVSVQQDFRQAVKQAVNLHQLSSLGFDCLIAECRRFS